MMIFIANFLLSALVYFVLWAGIIIVILGIAWLIIISLVGLYNFIREAQK